MSHEQTNNRAECMAAILALGTAYDERMTKVEVRTDSEYLANSINVWIQGWEQNGWMKYGGRKVGSSTLKSLLFKSDSFCSVCLAIEICG